MNSITNYLALALSLILGQSGGAIANTNSPDASETESTGVQPFPDGSLERWQEESFVGNTRYELHDEDGITVLKATAINAASVLYRKDAIDLTNTPWLEWSWKVESIFANINEKTKAGDDFPARLYVTTKTGVLPWQTVAINYVWSSEQPIDAVWANPYTKKSIMVSVQSGKQLAGQWVGQRRNIVDDFQQLFNIDVKRLSGYAVMVDGDNSKQTGTAYFGNIDFVAN